MAETHRLTEAKGLDDARSERRDSSVDDVDGSSHDEEKRNLGIRRGLLCLAPVPLFASETRLIPAGADEEELALFAVEEPARAIG